MNKIFSMGNLYVKNSDWKDFALVKICLFSLGIVAGCFVPKEKRNPVLIVAFSAFIATYIPLMTKFVKLAAKNWESIQDE